MKRKKYLILVAGLILTFLFCLGANGGQILTSLSSAGPVDLSLVENGPDTIVKVETKEGKPGEELKVPITIQNANGMAGAQFDLNYKPEVAVATAVETGDLVKGFMIAANLNEADNGKVTIGLVGTEGVTGNGTLVVVTFKLTGNWGDKTFLDILNLELNDENGKPIEAAVKNGDIVIMAAPIPTVKSTVPDKDATNVPIDTELNATFDQDISVVNAVYIKINNNPVKTEDVTAAGKKLTVKHADFAFNTSYTVEIGAESVKSVAYGTYNDKYTWSFTTVEAPKPKPTVKSTIPVNGAKDVPINTELSATFDQNISVVNAAYIKINDKPVKVEDITAANNKLTVKHADFAFNTSYTVEIGAESVQSVVYKTYNDKYSWSFTTVSPKPIPTVESTVPDKDAKDVPINTELSATFDQNISVVNAAYIKINNNPVKKDDVTAAGKKLTIKHADFAFNTSYTVEIGAGSVQSVVYKTYNDKYTWSFTTGAKMFYPLEIISIVAKDGDGKDVTTYKAGVMYNFEALLMGTLPLEINENERNILYIVQLKDNNKTYYNIGSFAKKKVNVVDETLGAGFKVPNTPGEYIVEAFVWNMWPSEAGTQEIEVWAEKKEIKITVGQ